MSDWIREAAAAERERQQRVGEFISAAYNFLDDLKKAVDKDLRAFKEEFPGIHVESGIPERGVELRVQRSVQNRKEPLTGRLVAIPVCRVLAVVHDPDTHARKEFPVEVEGDQLKLDAGSLEIRRALLYPILFPDLHTDALGLRHPEK